MQKICCAYFNLSNLKRHFNPNHWTIVQFNPVKVLCSLTHLQLYQTFRLYHSCLIYTKQLYFTLVYSENIEL